MAPLEESVNNNNSSGRPRGYTTTNTRSTPASEDSPVVLHPEFSWDAEPEAYKMLNTAPTKVPADTHSKKDKKKDKKKKPDLTSPPRLPPRQEQEEKEHQQRFGDKDRAYSRAHDSRFRISDSDSEGTIETKKMREVEDRYGPNPGYPSSFVLRRGAAQYNWRPPAHFRAGEYQPEPGQLPVPTTSRDDFRGDNLYRMPPLNAYSGPSLFPVGHPSHVTSDSAPPESETGTVTPQNFEDAHGDGYRVGLDIGRLEDWHNAAFPGQLPQRADNENNDWNIHDPSDGRHPSPPTNPAHNDSGNMTPRFPSAPRHVDPSETNYSGTTLVGRGSSSVSDLSSKGKKPGKPRRLMLSPVPSVASSESGSENGPISITSSTGEVMANVPFEHYSELQKGLGAPKQHLGYDIQGRVTYFNIPGTGKGIYAEREEPSQQRVVHLHDGDCYHNKPRPDYVDYIEEQCGCAKLVDYRPEPTPLTAWFKENGITTPVAKNKNLFGDRGWLEDTAAQDKPAQSTARIMNAIGSVFKSAKTIASELILTKHDRFDDQDGASSLSKVPEMKISLRPRDQAAIIMEIEVTCVEALSQFLHKQDLQNRTDAAKMKKIDDSWVSQGNVRPPHWRYSLQFQIEIMIVHTETFRFYGPAQNNVSVVAGLLHSAKQNALAIAKRSYGQPDSVIAKQMYDFYDFLELVGAPEQAIQAITNATLFFRIVVEREDIVREAEIKIRQEHNSTLDGHRDRLNKTHVDNREKLYKSLEDPCERATEGFYSENNGMAGVISADAFDEAARRLGRYEEAQAYMIRKTAEAREKGIIIDSPTPSSLPPAYETPTAAIDKHIYDDHDDEQQQFVTQKILGRTQLSTYQKSFQTPEANVTMGIPYEQTPTGAAPTFVNKIHPCTPTRRSFTSRYDGPPQLPMPDGLYLAKDRNLSRTQLFEVSPFDSPGPFAAPSTAVDDEEHAEQLALARRGKAVDWSGRRPSTPSVLGPSDSPYGGHDSGSFVVGTQFSNCDAFEDVPLYNDTARVHDSAAASRPPVGGSGFSTQTPSAGPPNLRRQYTLHGGTEDEDDDGDDDGDDDRDTVTGNACPSAQPNAPQDVSSSSRIDMAAARRGASYENMF